MSDQKLVIVFALFPGVTQLDFTGPHQVFSQLPGAEVVLATRAGEAVGNPADLIVETPPLLDNYDTGAALPRHREIAFGPAPVRARKVDHRTHITVLPIREN